MILVSLFLAGSVSALGSNPGEKPNPKLAEYLSTKPEYLKTMTGMITFRAKKTAVVGVATHRAANEFAPENTLSAIQCALDLQVDYIEMDVRQTKDGISVLLHDGNLNRTTNGKGPVKDMDFAEVHKLSAGLWFDQFFTNEKVPTLEEACQLLSQHNEKSKHKTYFYVDCKEINVKVLIENLKQIQTFRRICFLC